MKNRKREICTSGSVRDEAGQPPHLLGRRQFLHLAAGAAVLPAVSRAVRAQSYPTRPVRIIVGFPAGGGTDIQARLIGQWLSDRLGQQFVIDNRPGANTNIATEAVVRAPPDGYTLAIVTSSNAINATLYDKLNFNFIRDIAPIASIMRVPLIMVVHPSVPATTVPEFIAYASANPGKLNMAGANGASSHIAGELFKMMTGVNIIHVPYRGISLALNDLFSGQVQLTFDTLPALLEHIRAGKLRALAMTTAARSEALPDIPIMSDFVPGYEVSGWTGVGAPKDTPVEIIDKLNKEINAAVTNPSMQARFAGLGGKMVPSSPADFGKHIAAETEKLGKVIKFAGIRPE